MPTPTSRTWIPALATSLPVLLLVALTAATLVSANGLENESGCLDHATRPGSAIQRSLHRRLGPNSMTKIWTRRSVDKSTMLGPPFGAHLVQRVNRQMELALCRVGVFLPRTRIRVAHSPRVCVQTTRTRPFHLVQRPDPTIVRRWSALRTRVRRGGATQLGVPLRPLQPLVPFRRHSPRHSLVIPDGEIQKFSGPHLNTRAGLQLERLRIQTDWGEPIPACLGSSFRGHSDNAC
ncbi:hypothetical protein GY45DRAFT_134085 [Cubamyces sp. BRFM 1775]|nr:hypothetical protein GY45DRAFT_134085 [Cubamyces sp. BRFM 1775]